MAINFEWYKNPPKAGEEEDQGIHPRIVYNGKITTAELCKRVHQMSSLTVGDVRSAIDTLARICGSELAEGTEVHIEGLGYFAPVLGTTERVTTDMSLSRRVRKMRLKGVKFRPDAQLKERLVSHHVLNMKGLRHSASFSEIEIDIRLKEYFATHDIMFRTDFERVAHLSRATANRHLRRLQEEGKLHNIGTLHRPVYVPVPGFYGRSHASVRYR